MSPAPLALLASLVFVPLAACARSEPPPGTRPDNTPPRTERLLPEHGAVVPGFDGYARVEFDEPLMNPRNLGRDIVGSPAGRYEVKPGRRGLEVRPEDGWRDGLVYFIRLPAGVTDLLRNRRDTPVEWLFSTGGEIPPTDVTGRVVDRVTVRGESGLRVLFLGADSVPYTAVTDTGGVFRLPGLPFGRYEAAGFEDQDRDFAWDAEFEPGGSVPLELVPDTPEAELQIVMLPADTTPPVPSAATARDSLSVRLEFDDPLDPEADLADATLAVIDTRTGERFEVAEFAVGLLELPEPEPELDPDAALDPDAEPEPEDAEPPAEPPEPVGPAMPDLEPAADYMTLLLDRPLVPGVYRVEIDGVANLRGLRGGGSVTFEYVRPPELEPEPETEPAGEDADGEDADGEEAGEVEGREVEDSAGDAPP